MAPTTFLAPGQRYVDISATTWRTDQQLTILQIATHPGSPALVTYRSFDGSEETTIVTQFEAAIAHGLLVPVIGSGLVAAC